MLLQLPSPDYSNRSQSHVELQTNVKIRQEGMNHIRNQKVDRYARNRRPKRTVPNQSQGRPYGTAKMAYIGLHSPPKPSNVGQKTAVTLVAGLRTMLCSL